MLRGAYQPRGHEKAYFSDDKKQEARHFITRCWQDFSGRLEIPGQYWTLCGPMTRQGALQEGSELRQLEQDGLFQPVQFIGVEQREEVHRANEQAVAAAYPRNAHPALHHGDIIDVLHQYHRRKKLAASIVHLDSINELRAATTLLWRTLNILNHIDGPTMVVWNVISGRRVPKHISYPWDRRDQDTLKGRIVGYVGEYLMGEPVFRDVYRHGWDMFPDAMQTFTSCRYEGSRATQMTMYVFVRRRKACKDNCQC